MPDRELTRATDSRLTAFRRDHVGFAFQFYNLVPSLTARENVALVTEIARNPMPPEEALARVGLAHRLDHFPAELSGGRSVTAGTQVFTLNAIPGFIPAGDPIIDVGLSYRLVAVCQTLVHHTTSGLGMVTVLSATFFAEILGPATDRATTAAIGGIMIPEMERAG